MKRDFLFSFILLILQVHSLKYPSNFLQISADSDLADSDFDLKSPISLFFISH